MSVLSAILAGAVAGLKALAAALGLMQAKEERNEGAQAQVNVNLTAEVKADQAALEAGNAVNAASTVKSLQDGTF